MVDGSPQKHPFAGDPNHHLVEVPAIARPRTAPAQSSRDHRSECQNPTPDGFVRDVELSLGQEFLDVDSLLEERVSSELVSESRNSLLAGKIQGNSSILASSVQISRRKRELAQMLTVKFPTQRNRELIGP